MESIGQRVAAAPAVRWFRHHPLRADTLLGVVVALATIAVVANLNQSLIATETIRIPDSWPEWLLTIGPSFAIPLRRVAPAVAVGVGAVLQAALWLLAMPDTFIPMGILIYSATADGRVLPRRAGWAAAIGLTLFTVIGVIEDEAPIYVVFVVALFSSATAALGATAASRKAHAKAAEARADELLRSRQVDRERALLDERARIARELHDVVAHGLSVIVVQASAARRILDRDPAGTASALEQIEKTGRTSLNEMRQVLSAIRTDPAESWQPTPGLASLDDLVAELASTGLQVSVTETAPGWQPESDPEPLPATVDVTAYRIVQESLTNVLKHGGAGATATVDIARRPGSLDLRIEDDGRGPVGGDQGGHGLRGMQERVEVFGGRFDAGPRRGGGFAVSVSLPLDARDGAR